MKLGVLETGLRLGEEVFRCRFKVERYDEKVLGLLLRLSDRTGDAGGISVATYRGLLPLPSGDGKYDGSSGDEIGSSTWRCGRGGEGAIVCDWNWIDRGELVVSNSSALRIGSWRSVWIRHYRIVLCCFPVHDFDLMRQQLLRRYVFLR